MFKKLPWNSFVLNVLFASFFSPFTAKVMAVVDGVQEVKLSKKEMEQAFAPRRIVLMVGVGQFQDENFNALRFADKDVKDVENFLKKNNHTPRDLYISLVGPDATTAKILDALQMIENMNRSTNDTVMIYLSTHGSLAYENGRQLKRYAASYDTRFDDLPNTAIPVDFLEDRLGRMISTRKALILALCHSGAGKSQLPQQLQREVQSLKGEFFTQPLHESSSAMMVLSASKWGQPAREDDKLRNDIYTHFLLKGLRKSDSNGDGAVSLFEAHEFARTHTYDYTRGQQTPSALLNMEGSDPIILRGRVKRGGQPLLIADAEYFRGFKLKVNGRDKGSLWQPQNLPDGRVHIALYDPRNPDAPIVDHHVYLEQNQTYTITEMLAKKPRLATELAVQSLPLPTALESLSAGDKLGFGLGIRWLDISGTAYEGHANLYVRSHETKIDIDGEEANASYDFMMAAIGVGRNFSLSPDAGISGELNLNYLSIKRELANDSVANKTQRAATFFPGLGVVYRQKLLSIGYATIGTHWYPLRTMGVRVDGAKEKISPFSISASSGVIF